MSDFSSYLAPVKKNPKSTIIIIILVILLLTVIGLLFGEIFTGLFRKNLPGEKCEIADDCGEGLSCDAEICAIP